MLIFLHRMQDQTGVRGALLIYGFGLPFLLLNEPRLPNLTVAALIGADLIALAIYRAIKRRRVHPPRGSLATGPHE